MGVFAELAPRWVSLSVLHEYERIFKKGTPAPQYRMVASLGRARQPPLASPLSDILPKLLGSIQRLLPGKGVALRATPVGCHLARSPPQPALLLPHIALRLVRQQQNQQKGHVGYGS